MKERRRIIKLLEEKFEKEKQEKIALLASRKEGVELPKEFASKKLITREENSDFIKLNDQIYRKKLQKATEKVDKMDKFKNGLVKPHKYGKLSDKHNLIVYTSLLETIKPYLINTIRTPALQTLILCARYVDCSTDYTRFIFDNWIEVQIDQFTEIFNCKNFVQQAIMVRAAFDKRTENIGNKYSGLGSQTQKEGVNFLDKLARFLATDLKYFIGRLGPLERKSLIQEENAIELNSDLLNLEFVENCSGWLKIGTIDSLREQKKDKFWTEAHEWSSEDEVEIKENLDTGTTEVEVQNLPEVPEITDLAALDKLHQEMREEEEKNMGTVQSVANKPEISPEEKIFVRSVGNENAEVQTKPLSFSESKKLLIEKKRKERERINSSSTTPKPPQKRSIEVGIVDSSSSEDDEEDTSLDISKLKRARHKFKNTTKSTSSGSSSIKLKLSPLSPGIWMWYHISKFAWLVVYHVVFIFQNFVARGRRGFWWFF